MDEAHWNAELEKALKENYEAGPEAQADAIEAFLAEPSQDATDSIWKMLVGGLLVLLGICVLGIIGLILDDKDSQSILTAFSALLTGLLGVFIPSPLKKDT